MRIPLATPVWLVALKSPPEYRPILTHVDIRRTDGALGLATAADGWMAAVVPISLDEDDVPGLVLASHFAEAAKLSKAMKERNDAVLFLGADTVRFADGSTKPRFGNGVNESARFPDLDRVTPTRCHPDERARGPLALNPSLLVTISKAIGSEHTTITRNGLPTSCLVIETQEPTPAGRPVAPYGLLMPVFGVNEERKGAHRFDIHVVNTQRRVQA